MEKFKALLVTLILTFAAAAMAFVAKPSSVSANTSTENLAELVAIDNITGDGDSEELGDLIVLNGLFDSGCTDDLAELIAVDNITGDGDNEDLGDLIVLNGLFDGSTNDLAELIAVDNITGDGDNEDLGDLIVLNDLFDP